MKKAEIKVIEPKVKLVRPSWKQTWMAKAQIMGQRSTCVHYKVGAVFVTGDNRLDLVSGYNGPPSGAPHCIEVGCAKMKDGRMLPPGSGKCIGCHAEINGITNAACHGINIKETIVYCTFSPCRNCAFGLKNLSIRDFVYKQRYEADFEEVKEFFKFHKIGLTQF